MKTEWICTWSLIPGRERYVEKYSSEGEAKAAMARRIGEHFRWEPYVSSMRKEKDPDYGAAADYLEKFLSCLTFPDRAEASLPHLYGSVECFGDETELSWSCDYGCAPCLSARESSTDEEPGFFAGFCFQRPPKTSPVKGINIHIVQRKNYGTSAYPLMVLLSLRETPATQGEILRVIQKTWDTLMDRKAVGRHLQLLQELGFPVQHGPEGYSYSGEVRAPKSDAPCRPSAYPLLILRVLGDTPKTQAEILRAVQEQYGVQIDRKAVKRHLELLDSLGCGIQKCANGYFRKPEKTP